MKKVLSLLFACTMIFTMIPFSAINTFAEEEVGLVTVEDGKLYEIGSVKA